MTMCFLSYLFFFFQAEDGIRDYKVTGVQTCALPIFGKPKCERSIVTNTRPGNIAGITRCMEQLNPEVGRDRLARSEERRVGKEGRCRWQEDEQKKIQRERHKEKVQ